MHGRVASLYDSDDMARGSSCGRAEFSDTPQSAVRPVLSAVVVCDGFGVLVLPARFTSCGGAINWFRFWA